MGDRHSILRSVDAELDDLIAGRPAAARRIAILVAERAVVACGANDSLIREALQSLAQGRLGESARLRAELAAMAAEIEEPYLAELSDDAPRLSDGALAAFSHARAISAVCAAFRGDPVEAARDATYEALASMAEPASRVLVALLKQLLREEGGA